MATLLVVDDDPTVPKLIGAALTDCDIQVVAEITAAEGLSAIKSQAPDAVFLDIHLPDTSGLEIIGAISKIDSKLPVIFITASDDSNTAIEAMKVGAYDFLLKPLDMDQIQEVAERAIQARRMMQVPVRMSSAGESDTVAENGQDLMIGSSKPMLEVYKDVGRVAKQEVTVLICGESGTGKELVARAVYQHSLRCEKPFLAVNCAALSDTLLESELFGHEKGAFTGADRQRVGKFEQCTGGTIFLDEVGDMSPMVQSKVLRLLQEQRFERLGGRETIETDVRIISATNRDLDLMIDEGDFRLDLYHRLNGYRIDLPPLRDRGDDITRLIEHFLIRFGQQHGKEMQGVSPEAFRLLKEYAWPGNIREVQTVLRKSVLKTSGPVVVPESLPDEIQICEQPAKQSPSSESKPGDASSDLAAFLDQRRTADSENLYAETLEMMERYLVSRVLQESEGNQSKAAADLGISRGSLRNKIRTLGISIEHVVQPNDGEVDDRDE